MRKWIAPAMAVLLAVAAHLNSLLNGFVYDDNTQILNNPWLRDFHKIPRMFATNVWAFIGREGVSNYYRPLMHVFNLACYRLFGTHAWGYHLASILLHAGCALLVFYIGLEIVDSQAATWAALLFAVHPIHTEAIDWIAANNELGYSLLTMFAFLLHVRGRKWASVGAFAVALFLKEPAVMLLALIGGWELLRWRERGNRGPVSFTASYLVPLAIYLVMRFNAIGGVVAISNAYGSLALDSTLYTCVYLLARYLRYLVDPLPFSIYHVLHPVMSVADGRLWASLAAILALWAGAWRLWRSGSRLWFAVFWIVVPLAPAMFFQRVGDSAFGERYLYLPSAGFCWLLGALIARAPRSVARVPVAALLGGILVSWYTLTTVTRNLDFRDDETLFTRTLDVSPDAAVIRGDLAGVYLSRGWLERALPLYRQVSRERPLDAVAQMYMGVTLAKLGHVPEARGFFVRAQALRPDTAPPLYNLGLLAESQGDEASAERFYRGSLLRDAGFLDGQEALTVLLIRQGRFEEAMQPLQVFSERANISQLMSLVERMSGEGGEYGLASHRVVDSAQSLYLLGQFLQGPGRRQEAEICFQEMRRVLPKSKWKPPEYNQ